MTTTKLEAIRNELTSLCDLDDAVQLFKVLRIALDALEKEANLIKSFEIGAGLHGGRFEMVTKSEFPHYAQEAIDKIAEELGV